ncbi:cytochrome-c peroxidase [Azospira oryzae]|jgi:cytochrome c peroxidase|uniref:cytochrome-c peroxidase n=1 Tax=Azospira oryzae TaxID=146939 RepID=UPI0019633490|nr:cytochrome c peroxidase [Azospira oryzae]
MKTTTRFTLAAGAMLLALSATAAEKYPALGPLPPPPIPKDNPNTPAKVELGKKLFWDNRLSGDGSMPCVSCHIPGLGWGEGSQISRGYPGTKHWRNSQTVLNSAYYNKPFWEGSVTSLEQQAPAAAGGGVSGNGDDSLMEMRLRFLPEYVKEFNQVFGSEWPRINDAWRAIAAYERTIISDARKVPFDRYAMGDKKALSDSQKRGMVLYNGKANCIACHNGPLASNQKFYATGVPAHPQFKEDPVGQVTHRWEWYQKGVNEKDYRGAKDDAGLFYITMNPKDIGKWRVPSLRELKYTGPFMHNGMLATLGDVVEFYNQGGGEAQNKTKLLKPLKLTAQEKKDLLAFLEALSMDEPLIHDDPKLPGDYQPLPAPISAAK